MLLSGAKLSNTKTSRKGKFAFRLEGNGSTLHTTGTGSSVAQVGGGRGGCGSGSQAPAPTLPTCPPTCPPTHPGSTELKFILSDSSLDETLGWAVALERLDVASTFDPVEWPAPLSGRVAGSSLLASSAASPAARLAAGGKAGGGTAAGGKAAGGKGGGSKAGGGVAAVRSAPVGLGAMLAGGPAPRGRRVPGGGAAQVRHAVE